MKAKNYKVKVSEINTTSINKNFRIKVFGFVNGVKKNLLVGVSGLLRILGSWDKVVKFVERALCCDEDKCRCKVYGQNLAVTFYWK